MANRSGEVIPAPDADLCLNFANTRYWRGSATPTEDLTRWTICCVGPKRRSGCRPRWCSVSLGKRRFFEAAIALRETIHRCFSATASGRAPAEEDLGALNAALAAAPARQRVSRGGWDIGTPEPSAASLLAPALWSAADLLVSKQLERVRQCANPQCGWLFLDNSKSGNRRWCSMSACGNRAKAHRHYLRQKGQ